MPTLLSIKSDVFNLSFQTIYPMIRHMADAEMIEPSGSIIVLKPGADYVDLSSCTPAKYDEAFEAVVHDHTYIDGTAGNQKQLEQAFELAMDALRSGEPTTYVGSPSNDEDYDGAAAVINFDGSKLIVGVVGFRADLSRVIAEAMAWLIVAVS